MASSKPLRPQCKVGDELFGSAGMKMGAHSEYLAIKDSSILMKKPAKATFEEAAAVLFGGMTAIYILQKAGIANISQPKVLIYGATGSVGVAAIEVAKHYGAHVTAVCSHRGAEMAKSLGADALIDYTKEDFTQRRERNDIIFDALGKTKKKQIKKMLVLNGKYHTVGGMDVAKETKEQVALLAELFENGELKASIDKSYPLAKASEAHAYVDSGRKKGNVVLSLET